MVPGGEFEVEALSEDGFGLGAGLGSGVGKGKAQASHQEAGEPGDEDAFGSALRR